MVKIQRLPNGQLVITIPKQLANFKGWKKGMDVQFREHDKDSFIVFVSRDGDKDESKVKKKTKKEVGEGEE